MADLEGNSANFSMTDAMKKWIIAGIIIALAGVGVTIYSTVHHVAVKSQGSTDMACNINDEFSCDDVALSEFSEIGSVPLAILGLGYFLAILSLLGLGLGGGKTAKEHLHAYVAMVIIGVVTSVVLFGISYFQIGALCLSCIGVYVVTLVQGVNLLAFKSAIPPGFNAKETISGLTTGAIAVALVVAVYLFVDPVSSSRSNTAANQGEDNPELPATDTVVQDIPIAKSAYVGLGEDFRYGPDNAKVVIQEFADFECPACGSVATLIGQLKREFGNQVLFVFRNYPLDQKCNDNIKRRMHPMACDAAVMARCAGQYGKFWEAHDIIFANQDDLSDANLLAWAKQLGITEEQYNVCKQAPEIVEKIKADIELGQKVGVNSTPTLFINGRKYIGNRSYIAMKREIEKQLAQ